MRLIRRSTPRSPFPTADEIADRAHDLFVADGRRVTRIRHYWRMAETELLERAASEVLGSAGVPPPAKGGRGAGGVTQLSRSKR